MEKKHDKSWQGQSDDARSQAARKCKYCGLDTHEDVIAAAFWTESGLIVVQDIPARLCEGCGEQFFAEEITQRIQKVLTRPAAMPKRQIRVPVYSMSQVGAKRNDRGTFFCKYCGSRTVGQKVKSAFWLDGRLLAVESIPARVCPQCKEQFYDDETADKIASLKNRRSVPETSKRDISVPVFSLAAGGRALANVPGQHAGPDQTGLRPAAVFKFQNLSASGGRV